MLKQLLKKTASSLNEFKKNPNSLLVTYNNYLMHVQQEIQFMYKYELKKASLKSY
ncbi:MAG: hypothetical protein IPG85_01960 [Bacteroidetes bacterium]|nr:hypothetical protein [Bacteroidota bacterium]